MTVKKLGMVLVAVSVLLTLMIAPVMAGSEDEEYDKMVDYLNENESSNTVTTDDNQAHNSSDDVSVTPSLAEGEALFNEFSFAVFCHQVLSLLYYIFYYGSCAAILYVGVLAIIDVLKGKKDLKSIYNDISHTKSVQAIVVVILVVKGAYIVVDFLFKHFG